MVRLYFLGWGVLGRARFVRGVLRRGRWREVDEYVDRVHAPAFVVHGEKDRLVPVRIALELGRRLPRAEVRTVPDVGHVAHLERPETMLSAIASALALYDSS